MNSLRKISVIIVLLLFSSSFSISQEIKFAVCDGIDLSTTKGTEKFTEIINTLNQIPDIDFVIFNRIRSELLFNNNEIENLVRKLSHPVYFMPDHSTFWQEKAAREKFYAAFGDMNFFRSKDSLGILGLSSAVEWSPDPFFEREVFNFISSDRVNKKDPLILVLNNSPVEIKNFDDIVEPLDSAKIKFIVAPLISDKLIYPDEILLINAKNIKSTEAFKIIDFSGDTLMVTNFNSSGRRINSAAEIIKGKSFKESTADITYDPNKIERWSFDLGYSLAADIVVESNNVFAADVSGQVVRLNSNGKKVWEYYSFGYIYSTPVIKDNYLAIATIQGDLETIDARNGKALQSLGFDSPITTDLTAFDFTGPINLMIPKQSGSKGAVLVGTQSGQVFCYDLETLQEHWRFDDASGAILGKPLVTKEHVFFFSGDGHLYSLSGATGLLTWKAKLAEKNELSLYPSEIVHNNEDVFIALSNGKIFSFDILLGRKNWEYDKYDLTTSLSISDDGRLLYAKSNDDRFHILSAKLGTWVKEIYTKLGNHQTETDILEVSNKIYFGNDIGIVYKIDEDYSVSKFFRKSNSTIHSIKKLNSDEIVTATHNGIITVLKTGE